MYTCVYRVYYMYTCLYHVHSTNTYSHVLIFGTYQCPQTTTLARIACDPSARCVCVCVCVCVYVCVFLWHKNPRQCYMVAAGVPKGCTTCALARDQDV
mmetsp:Transcript_31314/g.50596  ORF Transcript_31314/g.50596 Transcript_31314/m.50596 type:complete len:98 (-) Transcript_31314:2402-2695(-)